MGSCAIRQSSKSSSFKPTSLTGIKETLKIPTKFTASQARQFIYTAKDAKAPILNLYINPLYIKRSVKSTL
ncbi:hypothetical protein SteCoe_23832 [Stentor coeruleus]|uniref:Uncharacterized protein n=1 Tax=Stentor coeruleus TaxID=5963 RepID=A0A1R2BIZ7_9CILI|nr:hypothetical protein SteCoe_23832 [Stentor coeruleus]